VLHLAGLEQIGDDVKALNAEGVARLLQRRGDVLGHRVPPRSEGLEDRTRTGLLREPHDHGPEPVWEQQDEKPNEINHGSAREP